MGGCDYYKLNRFLKKATCQFTCRDCENELEEDENPRLNPLDFKQHRISVHGFDQGEACLWCDQPFPQAGVKKNGAHLWSCLQRREKEYREKLDNYHHLVSETQRRVYCSRCEEGLATVVEFQNHAYSVHGLKPAQDCPWCLTPNLNGLDHQLGCFIQLKQRKQPVLLDDFKEDVKTIQREKECCLHCLHFDAGQQKCVFYNYHDRIPNVHASFYEMFEKTPFMAELERDQKERRWIEWDDESGLGRDSSLYVQCFSAYTFIHVYVKGDAFESFHKLFFEDGQTTVGFLEHSCLCSAGCSSQHVDAQYTHHRHGIAICKNIKHFMTLYGKVQYAKRKYADENCKSYRVIKSQQHLAYALSYIGHTYSVCKGLGIKERDIFLEGEQNQNHYFLFRPFSQHAHFFLHLSYQGGFQDYIKRMHGNRNIYTFLSLDWRGKPSNLRALVPLSEFLRHGKDPEYCSPPLGTHMRIVDPSTPQAFVGFWLLDGQEVWVKKRARPRTQSRQEFLQQQPRKYLQCLRDEPYVLERGPQRWARHLREGQEPVMRKLKAMEEEKNYEIERLKTECQQAHMTRIDTETEHQQLQTDHQTLQTIHTQFETDHEKLQSDYRKLGTEHQQLQGGHLQGEHEKLQSEYRQFQATLLQKEETDHQTLQTIHTQLETDHEKLQSDYRKLCTEHQQLQGGYQHLQGEHEKLQSEYRQFQATLLQKEETEHEKLRARYQHLQSEHQQLRECYQQLRMTLAQTEREKWQTIHTQLETDHEKLQSEHPHLQAHPSLQTASTESGQLRSDLKRKTQTVAHGQPELDDGSKKQRHWDDRGEFK